MNGIHVRPVRFEQLKFGSSWSEQCRKNEMEIGESQADREKKNVSVCYLQEMMIRHT